MKRYIWLIVILFAGCAPGHRAQWRHQLDTDVSVVASSENGSVLYTYSHGVLTSWDAATSRIIATKNLDGFMPVKLSNFGESMVAFSAEGSEILFWENDDLENIRAVGVGEEKEAGGTRELSLPGESLTASSGLIVGAGVSSDGTLAVCDAVGSAGLWDGEELRQHFTVSGRVAGSRLSPDGKTLVLIEPQAIHIFGLPDGEKKGEITHHGQLRGLHFSPDGSHFALISARQVKILRRKDLTEVASLPGVAQSVSFSADGRYFCATNVGSIDVWDIQDGRLRGSITLLSVVQSEVLGTAPHVITLRKQGVDLWSLDHPDEPIWSYQKPIRMMCAKPDGVWVYTAGGWLESWRLPL